MTSYTPLHRPLRRRLGATLAALALTTGGLSACNVTTSAEQNRPGTSATVTDDTIWDPDSIHEVALDLDEDDFAAMVKGYEETGEKQWLLADVTIDGQTIRDAGVRLKGNSSLRGVDQDADPAELPWLIDLDQFVDDQRLDGWEAFVIRSNNSETSLNEVVALDLLQEAGLASQEAVTSRFSVNDSDATLRLMVQDLDNRWDEATFGTNGTLYKAEAGGDWSYRGDEAASYDDVFDIEAGTEDYEPLTDFLQWLEGSSDEEFAEDLADRLDVDAFASYLAFEELIGNFDDIDGPGNNAFLRWDAGNEKMTVVAWDHNLAFGGIAGTGGRGEGGGPPEGGEPPEGFEPPTGTPDGERPEGGIRGGPGGSNVLAERFRDTPQFADLLDEAAQRLKSELFDGGTSQEILDSWTSVLTEQATDMVDVATVEEEAQQIESYFDGHALQDPDDGGGAPPNDDEQ